MKRNYGNFSMLIVLVFLLVFSSLAFASEDDPIGLGNNAVKDKNIGFIQLTLGTTYHAAMSDRFEELCKIYGANVDMVVSQNRTADEQMKLAEDLVAKGVEYLILNPIGDEIVPAVVKLAQSKNIPLICVDNTSPGVGYIYVGINNFSIAREIGRYVGKVSDGGNIVYLRSVPTDTGCPALRFSGIMAGISDQGEVRGYKIIDERWAEKDVGEAEGMMQMEDLLASNPQIDIVIAHHDAQGLGALTAIRNSGRNDIKILCGFDGEKRMLEEIKKAAGGKNGGIDIVTGLNSPTMIAEIALKVINDLAQNKEVQPFYYIPVLAISYENVDEYMSYGF